MCEDLWGCKVESGLTSELGHAGILVGPIGRFEPKAFLAALREAWGCACGGGGGARGADERRLTLRHGRKVPAECAVASRQRLPNFETVSFDMIVLARFSPQLHITRMSFVLSEGGGGQTKRNF